MKQNKKGIRYRYSIADVWGKLSYRTGFIAVEHFPVDAHGNILISDCEKIAINAAKAVCGYHTFVWTQLVGTL